MSVGVPSARRAYRVVDSLCDRMPQLDRSQLVGGLVPPPHFRDVSFDSYVVSPDQPSQAAAVDQLQAFARGINEQSGSRRRFGRAKKSQVPTGIYLDGGFGVGKTHLLASLWHATAGAGARAYATFVELTNLVGALGFEETVQALADYKLVCIDEFELDDPGDTVMMSSLAMRLVQAGVRLAATSNTLPDRLGEERFAADDFLREIQGLASHFVVVRIDGDDYRHRGLPQAPLPLATEDVRKRAQATPGATLDRFEDVITHLGRVHPSRYGALIGATQTVGWLDVRTLDDQSQALRLVALVDRMYDADVQLIASGRPVDEIFTPDMLAGGYRKKYRRAVSRLTAMVVP